MIRVLVINSSPNWENSVSRDLTRQFVENWHRSDPSVEAVHRHIGMAPLPQLDQETITAYYTSPDSLTAEQQSALTLSNQIVSEVEAAEVTVIGLPMNNFGIP
jgi:FMN-dependent NADH-azoreductase